MTSSNSLWEEKDSLAKQFWDTGKLPFPVYDMHGHMGAHNAIYFARCEAPQMIQHMQHAGIRKLVFSHHQALFDTAFSNREAYEITKQHSDFLRMYAAVNPHQPKRILEDLKSFDSWAPLVMGFKFLPDYHRVKTTDPGYAEVLRFADERRLPILFHTWGGSPFDGADVLLETTQRYPHILYFFGHSFAGDFAGAKKVHEQSPARCYFELTSLPGQNGVLETLVRDIGSEHLLFGTDLPWFDEFQAISGVLGARITDQDKRNIFCDNAERLFGKNW